MLKEQLTAGLNQLGLSLDAFQIEQLLAYVGLLEKWNKTYNLTAVRKPRDMISHHLLDSLAILPWVSGDSLIDVGSGAGLPGVPLAIARPEMAVTLVDSLGKRCRFLSHVARELKLNTINVVESRAEDWVAAEQPALITARAVAALPVLLEQTRHLFAADTVMLAAKGRWPQTELEALPADFRLAESIKLDIPGVTGERHLLRVILKNNQ